MVLTQCSPATRSGLRLEEEYRRRRRRSRTLDEMEGDKEKSSISTARNRTKETKTRLTEVESESGLGDVAIRVERLSVCVQHAVRHNRRHNGVNEKTECASEGAVDEDRSEFRRSKI